MLEAKAAWSVCDRAARHLLCKPSAHENDRSQERR